MTILVGGRGADGSVDISVGKDASIGLGEVNGMELELFEELSNVDDKGTHT